MQKARFFTPLSVEEVWRRHNEFVQQVAQLSQMNEEYNRKYHPEKFIETPPVLPHDTNIKK